MMPEKAPQNPIYSVEPAVLDACLPKAQCPLCGTIIGIRFKAKSETVRCPGCQGRLRVRREAGAVALEAAPPTEDGPVEQSPE